MAPRDQIHPSFWGASEWYLKGFSFLNKKRLTHHGPSTLQNPNPVPSPFQVNFPSNNPFSSPGSPWNAPYRSRCPSWHGTMDNMGMYPGWLSAPPIGHQRTRSFGDHAAFPGFNQQPPMAPSGPPCLHPYLNGGSPHRDLIFDLPLLTSSPI